MLVYLIFLLIPLSSESVSSTRLSSQTSTQLNTLFPRIVPIIETSYTYSSKKARNDTGLVSLYCDIVLINFELENCLYHSKNRTYVLDNNRRLVLLPSSTNWGNEQSGWRIDGARGFIEYVHQGQGYTTALRFNSEICSLNNIICEECEPTGGDGQGFYSPCTNVDNNSETNNTNSNDNLTANIKTILIWTTFSLILIALVLMTIIIIYRKGKVISAALWPLLILICFGTIIIYSTGLLQALDYSCVTQVWLREIGFTLIFGSVLLKIYRSLVEFRTRKAHRWIVREKDILTYLAGMLCIVIFYLTAWTVGGAECEVSHWHRVTEIGELFFLSYGCHLAWGLRNASTPYKENILYTITLILESVCNLVIIVMRDIGPLLGFSLGQWLNYVKYIGSTTLVLCIIVLPKFYFSYKESKKPGKSGARIILDGINGDLDLDIHLDDMEIGDIRNELKRVYTQLEHFRNKTMRKDNPHISKRRGGRKPTHRRFSLQKKSNRSGGRKHTRSFRYNEDIEDSVCSVEGPSTYSEAGR